MFTIDGMTWSYPVDVTRNAEMRASEVSGEMLDGSYYNDVLGTYMNYTVRVVCPLNQRNLANSLYEILTEPVEGHSVTLPYNGTNLIVVGRIENVSDVFVRLPNGQQYWKGLQFTVIANHPTRALDGNQIISRGRMVMPETVDVTEGDTWTWHNGAWVQSVDYDDADEMRF